MHRLPSAGKGTLPSDHFSFNQVRAPSDRECGFARKGNQPATRCCLRPAFVCLTRKDDRPRKVLSLENVPRMRDPNAENQCCPPTQPPAQDYPRPHHSYSPIRCRIDLEANLPAGPPPPKQHQLPYTRACAPAGGPQRLEMRECARPAAPSQSEPDQCYDISYQVPQKNNNKYVIKEKPIIDTFHVFPPWINKPCEPDARRRNSHETTLFTLRLKDWFYPRLERSFPLNSKTNDPYDYHLLHKR